MKSFFRFKLLPIVTAFISATLVMLLFEFINSKIYPFPQGANLQDPATVQALAASLPWTAYILVFLGWAVGGFVAGYISAKISKEETYRVTLFIGLLLFLAGWVNYFMLKDFLIFYIFTTPLFFLTTYFGFKLSVKQI